MSLDMKVRPGQAGYLDAMLRGHRIRTGHEPDMRLVPSKETGIYEIVRDCCNETEKDQ